ncbi:MAG: hypothetical protein HY535_00695 [Chloroflexi bacterium]|nr:hypothetical protein [Chloroflexota bacterium]
MNSMQKTYVGIYFNPKEKVVVRITSPYWIPEGPDWVQVTQDPNTTLASIRQLLQEERLVSDPSVVRWGSLPLRE